MVEDINPAIKITSSVVSGLAVIEIFKLLMKRSLSSFNNTIFNLSLPFFGIHSPLAPKKTKIRGSLNRKINNFF